MGEPIPRVFENYAGAWYSEAEYEALHAECERLREREGRLDRIFKTAIDQAVKDRDEQYDRAESALTAGRELAEAVEQAVAGYTTGTAVTEIRAALDRFREATDER